MDWQKLFLSLDGRISRQPFWIGMLVLVVVNVVAGAVLGRFLSTLVGIALIYPSVCVSVKRWHDRGKSGWWVLIGLIPVIGWIWTLVECGFLPGTGGTNEYGSDPMATSTGVA
jgi:uncharacterized membrane protein YhaH (DUF805 family)